MNRPQILAATATAVVFVAVLAGCSAAPAPKPSQVWSDRMTALFDDPHGQGGAGGGLKATSGSKSAHDLAVLASVATGSYDVLAVCEGSGTVRLAVRTIAPPRTVLASSDIACGATLRLPVTLTSRGVVLEASNSGAATEWQASIVSPGWQPALTNYSH